MTDKSVLDAKKLAGLGTAEFLRECFRQMDSTDQQVMSGDAGTSGMGDASRGKVGVSHLTVAHNPRDPFCRCVDCVYR